MGSEQEVDPLRRLTPAGRRILDVAADSFYRQGIHVVGVDAIATGAGVTKKTLYACFGSKDQLVAAYLAERDQRWRTWLTGWIEERAEAPAEKLLLVFDALGVWMEQGAFRGCGFVNALAELPSADHPAHALIIEQKRWVLDYLVGLAEAAGVSDPADRARSLFLLVEGVTVAVPTAVTDAARQARKTAAALLASELSLDS